MPLATPPFDTYSPLAEITVPLATPPLSIVSEITLPIVHCLVAKSPIQVTEVTTLRSYPAAFDQCREFVHAHLELEGYRVREAASAEQALATIARIRETLVAIS